MAQIKDDGPLDKCERDVACEARRASRCNSPRCQLMRTLDIDLVYHLDESPCIVWNVREAVRAYREARRG